MRSCTGPLPELARVPGPAVVGAGLKEGVLGAEAELPCDVLPVSSPRGLSSSSADTDMLASAIFLRRFVSPSSCLWNENKLLLPMSGGQVLGPVCCTTAA